MLDLIVSYADKEDVKRRGAFWDIERKVWVIPDHIREINAFHRWIPFQSGCVVRKPYLICLSKTTCWKCGKETPMVALGAENYFEFAGGSWVKVSEQSLFSWVLTLDAGIAQYMREHYPFFKNTYSRTLQMAYYGNTCISCGKLQGDFFHHEEPGGAFFPDPFDYRPASIILKNIDIRFDYHIDASFGGMAYDNMFSPQNKAQSAKHGLSIHILKS